MLLKTLNEFTLTHWARGRHFLRGASARRVHARGRRIPHFEHLEIRRLLAVVDYPLVNQSFESPSLSISNTYHNAVNGWVHTAGMGTTFEVPSAEASPASQGDQYVWGDLDNWAIRQAGPTIAANTRYILSVDLFPLATGANRAEIYLQDGVSLTSLDEAVYHPTWNPMRADFDLPAGQWSTVTLAFNSADFSSRVGRATQVYIGGSRLAVDNVRVTVDDSIHDFYLSSSSGSGANDGFSPDAAWNDFSKLAPYLPLLPGERVLLKAGDVFSGELNLRGKGTAIAPVELTSYGSGVNPIIRRNDVVNGIGVVWNNASFANISNIDVELSKLGLYLRYEWTDSGSTNVTIEHCNFRDFPDPTLDPSAHNYEFAWSTGIFVGGQPWNTAEFATRLNNLTIRHITADNVGVLFGTGWYYPGIYKSRITNLLLEDCLATNCLNGSFQLFYVDGATVRRVHAIGGGGQDTWCGLTMGFAQSSKNVVIEDCEFSLLDRAQGADGTGMDFEGNNENIIFRNNVIHANDGSALLILHTDGPNTNITITGNVFYNNARDPWNSSINSEVQGSISGNTGTISNNGIYRGDSSISFLSTSSNWSGFSISGNRQLDYSSVRNRPTWWDFNTPGDLAGWNGFNHWGDALVTGGVLAGTSIGVDPYVQSPPTWVNTNLTRYVWVRMSQTAGAFGQIFYITETDSVWDGNKRVDFPIIADGVMRDYFVDLGGNANTKGVITQTRLDPTVVSGSTIAVDFFRFTNSLDLNQTPPPPPPAAPTTITFTSSAAEDGNVLESSQNSGQGGIVSSAATTFHLGDDAGNRAYRQFMSFDTSSLPDNAVVVKATIGITRIGNPTGTIPIGVATSQFGDLLVDLATPGFGTSTLTVDDWQAPATKLGVSKFAWPAYSNNMRLYSRLESSDNDLISLTGKTQFRVRYQNDDDGDGVADYMSYATSNHATAAYRPGLTIEYYIAVPSADFVADGVVDGADFLAWQRGLGTTSSATSEDGDANQDGDVDADDLTIWKDQFGNLPSATTTIDSLSAFAFAAEPPSTNLQSGPGIALVSLAAYSTDTFAWRSIGMGRSRTVTESQSDSRRNDNAKDIALLTTRHWGDSRRTETNESEAKVSRLDLIHDHDSIDGVFAREFKDTRLVDLKQ